MGLKPCPFCGGEAKKQGDEYSERVVCANRCGGCTEWDKDIMTRAWNTRATDPLLKEMAEVLEEIVRCLSHGLQDCRASVTAKKMLQKYHERESTQC